MTNHTKKVSIIIPVYNGANFLAEAIDSALSQTYGNLEIIVVNDGSNDDGATEAIAKSYGTRITYFLKTNGGVASALNHGIQRMAGDYFSWLSHDDLYESTKIDEEIKFLLAQPDPSHTIVGCNSYALFQNGMKKREKINRNVFDSYFDIFLGASAKVGLNGCSLLIPAHLLTGTAPFRENLPVTQDYDLWHRLSESAKFVLLDKSLVVYRHHDMQDSIQKVGMILMSGDELRARILQRISKNRFAQFMASDKNNEKWIWGNYNAYKARGYIKVPLVLLNLLASYYVSNSKISSRIEAEIVGFEHAHTKHYDSDAQLNDGEMPTFTARTNATLDLITEDDYKTSGTISRNKLLSYVESVKSDGMMFLVEKALRKSVRLLRQKKK